MRYIIGSVIGLVLTIGVIEARATINNLWWSRTDHIITVAGNCAASVECSADDEMCRNETKLCILRNL